MLTGVYVLNMDTCLLTGGHVSLCRWTRVY